LDKRDARFRYSRKSGFASSNVIVAAKQLLGVAMVHYWVIYLPKVQSGAVANTCP
jgi:hypothetical protein